MISLIRRLALLTLVSVFAFPVMGCKKDEEEETEETTPEETAAPQKKVNVMEGAIYKTIPATNVQVPIPRGWRVSKKGLYAFAASPDKKALLAFTTVSSMGEFVGRSQHAQKTFNITECVKKPVKKMPLGPNKLPSRVIDHECKFNGIPAFVSTVLVNNDKRSLPFIIYAVDKRASKKTIRQAQLTVLSMRKK